MLQLLQHSSNNRAHCLICISAVLAIAFTTTRAVPLSDFVEFGIQTAGDRVLGLTDRSVLRGYDDLITTGTFPFSAGGTLVDTPQMVSVSDQAGIYIGEPGLTSEPWYFGGSAVYAAYRLFTSLDRLPAGTDSDKPSNAILFREVTDSNKLAAIAAKLAAKDPSIPTGSTWTHAVVITAYKDNDKGKSVLAEDFSETNTWQTVLITDGIDTTYLMYLYLDGGMNVGLPWVQNVDSSGANMIVPGSGSSAIYTNMFTMANTGVPGLWAFSIGSDDGITESCTAGQTDTGFSCAPANCGDRLQRCVYGMTMSIETAPGTLCFDGMLVAETDARCGASPKYAKDYCAVDRSLHCQPATGPSMCSDGFVTCSGGQLHEMPAAAGTKCFEDQPVMANAAECAPVTPIMPVP